MLKRPHYIALTLVLFLVLVALNLPSHTATQVKLALGGFFMPLFGLASSAHSLADQAGHALVPRRALVNQIEQLRRENHQFRVRETQVAELWGENDRLREALRLQKQIPWKVQFARIAFRDPANWWRSVRIDVGRRDGVVADLPVLTMDGLLVGRVLEVGNRSSRVALVGDPDCGVSAMVEEGQARDYGVIASGASILDGSLVELTYVNRPTASKPGQRVLTSGLGGVFPSGILIGHIVDTTVVGHGLYTEARVKLGANLDTLEDVWVVIP
jgi:rod shape-determining protein MreC